jgi:hypothetical protein
VLASVTKAEVLEGAGRLLAIPLGQQYALVSASAAWKIQWLRLQSAVRKIKIHIARPGPASRERSKIMWVSIVVP